MSNKDFDYDLTFGVNRPRISHGLSGRQFTSSQDSVSGKRPTEGPPMIINNVPPGEHLQDDGMWITSYGSSHDAFLTIIPGTKVQDSIDNLIVSSIYKNGLTNADDDNLWKTVNETQQVQFISSKDTIEDGLDATNSFGEISEARGIGIRLPGMAGGWGRTIDLLPTDPQPTADANGRKNDDEHKLARETWKYGPVDARWDYRRNVWATYNDLIADHYGQQLGTWIFGTNPDTAAGFPFLRGRLDDVFWVRQPLDLAGSNGRSEGVQTGRVMTHLEHEWYDNEENGSAPLSSIFIIPHTLSTSDCHTKEGEQTLGPEITGDSQKIDIKTSVHFFKEPGVDGQIKFGQNVNDLNEVCCEPDTDANWFLGEMVFVPKDYTKPSCNGDPRDIPLDENGNPIGECEWVPAVQIDECQLVGEHFVTLVNNDQQVALMVCALCDEIKSWSTALIGTLVFNDAILEKRIDKTREALQSVAKQLCDLILKALTAANNFSQTLQNKNDKTIEQLIEAIYGSAQVIDGQLYQTPGITGRINETLNECIGKEEFLPETSVVDANGLGPTQTGTAEDGSPIAFDPDTAIINTPFQVLCPPGVVIASPFKCDVTIDFGSSGKLDNPDPFENCPSVDLKTPCGDPGNFTVDCDNPISKPLTTQYGKCQAHED